MSKKVIIVGGVAAGASTAARLRRMDETLEIIIFEKGEFISFANCGLPYHIGEVISDRSSLILQTPETMKARFNLDFRILSEVVKVDPRANRLTIQSQHDGVYEESFDILVLAPGARPMRPPIQGMDSSHIFSLRDLKDMDRIKAKVDAHNTGHAIVIGGGFIGVEAAENMAERGLNVTLVEAAPHILAPFDTEMAMIAEKEMVERGIALVLNDGVKAFIEEKGGVKVVLSSGKELHGDFVVSAIGVTPDTAFLRDSGISLGVRGHILTDETLRTNFPHIYAGGDAVEIRDALTGAPTAIPLAGPANRQGRIIADNIAGRSSTYKGAIGTSILKVFDLHAAATGLNERNARRFGYPAKAIYIHPNNHAGYYPGATQLTLKLVFDEKTRKVLGAQATGYEGVDKFIDVIATALHFGSTVDDLTELELAYAPPFLSAKSPANMAGFVAENTLEGRVDHATMEEFHDTFDAKTMILLDVRDALEVENGALDGQVHIPLNDLRQRMRELPKNKLIFIYCQVGLRGYIAARILMQHGYTVKNLTGGYKLLSLMHKSTETSTTPAFDPAVVGDQKLHVLDATGLCCPGPLMRVKEAMDPLAPGEMLSITASDMGFYEDIKAWARRTGNEALSVTKEKGLVKATLKKNPAVLDSGTPASSTPKSPPLSDAKTMIVFSGELDKAIASFIIANGAAAMGKKVTMFFTFWGMNILRKSTHMPVKKTFLEKMFGFMMPKGPGKLPLSSMNMAGMGPKMIRYIMEKKNVQSLEELIRAAMESGVEVVACQMSMDLLGLKEEELLDGVKYGGVGYMLAESDESNATFFI